LIAVRIDGDNRGSRFAIGGRCCQPDVPGRFPVLVERTPYDKSAPSRSERIASAAKSTPPAELAALDPVRCTAEGVRMNEISILRMQKGRPYPPLYA